MQYFARLSIIYYVSMLSLMFSKIAKYPPC